MVRSDVSITFYVSCQVANFVCIGVYWPFQIYIESHFYSCFVFREWYRRNFKMLLTAILASLTRILRRWYLISLVYFYIKINSYPLSILCLENSSFYYSCISLMLTISYRILKSPFQMIAAFHFEIVSPCLGMTEM